MNKCWPQVCALLGTFAISAPASADNEYDIFKDPFRIYFGLFYPTINSEIGINGDSVTPGPPIDVEELLGVTDSKAAALGGIIWHISPRNTGQFEYFSLNREGSESGTFSPPIQIGDNFIEAGSISTSYKTSLGRLTYGFSLIRSERTDFQLKAGLHVVKLEAGIGLSGQICDPTTVPTVPPGCPTAGTGQESEDVTAPLPHFGVSYRYAMTPTLAVNVNAIGFALEIDSIDGSIIEIDADIAWQPWRHFGFGAGVRYFKTDIKAGTSELNGEFNFDYLGPAIYVHTTF